MNSLRWKTYPLGKRAPDFVKEVVAVFGAVWDETNSAANKLISNDALAKLQPGLSSIGFVVEMGKTATQKVSIPVLFGENGKVVKSFDADAFRSKDGVVIEVEAGQAVDNHRFLKDFFQACVMQDAKHLMIAVQTSYGTKNKNDYTTIERFFDTLYASQRVGIPLESVTIIGY